MSAPTPEKAIAEKWFLKLEGASLAAVGKETDALIELLEVLDEIDMERNGFCARCNDPKPLGICEVCGREVEDMKA